MGKLSFGTKLLLVLVITVVVSLGAMITFVMLSSKSNSQDLAQSYVKSTVKSYANEQLATINSASQAVKSMINRLETAVNSGEKLTKEGMVEFQKNILRNEEFLYTAWVSFEDDSYLFERYDGVDKNPYFTKSGVFQPFVTNDNGRFVIEPSPDFDKNDIFIKSALDRKSLTITEPYEFEVDGKKVLMITVSAPLMAKGKIIGVVGVDFTLKTLNENISNLQLFDSGYMALYDVNGRVLSHPNQTLIGKVLSSVSQDKNVLAILEESKKQKEYEYISKRLKDGRMSYSYSYPYEVLGKTWTMICSVPVEEYMAESNSMINKTLIIALIVMALIIVVVIFNMRVLSRNLATITSGLLGFFSYLNKETSNVQEINLKSEDEFGVMAKVINENMIRTQNSISVDMALVQNIKDVVNEVKEGYIKSRVQQKTSNDNLEELKNIFNEMLDIIQDLVCQNVNILIGVLEDFAKLNFKSKVDDNGKVAQGVNNLSQIINNMLRENKANGLTLQESSKSLLENVDKLNISSNSAAASLEETAAALEQITSNIRNNTESIAKMAKYSNEITKASSDGEKLANQTTVAMDEINTQVNLVNEAISVIDQIAFQTNILSLNAAVEAATAGEAGKGFAVVAQEVRNLANRSAEAAREIKEIVEQATLKANEGKEIASNMIDGYKGLNDSISQTINLISDIEMSSKEQLSGIEQINDAVNSLDRQTQQNAAIASEAHDIAVVTDEIARLIVEEANQKEFDGKNDVKPKNIDVKHSRHTSTQASVNQVKKETKFEQKNDKTHTHQTQVAHKPTNIVKDNSSDDEWESF